MLTNDHDYTWGGDETVDIGDLKSPERKLVWVRVPPALLFFFFRLIWTLNRIDTIGLACGLPWSIVIDMSQV